MSVRLWFSVAQEAHSLHPDGLAELIHAARLLQAVSCCKEALQVPGKAGRLAGDIHNTVHPVGEDLRQGFGMNALPRRIQNDHIRLFFHFIQDLQHIPGQESAVLKAVQHRVLPGGGNRVLHDLHADNLLRHRGKKLGDGPGAAVQVKNFQSFCVFNVIPDYRVQNLCRQRIGLEKGERADSEFKSQKSLIEPVFPVKDPGLVALHYVRQRIVDDMHDPHDPALKGKRKKHLLQRLQIVLLLAGGNKMDQDFPCRHSSSQDKMAQISRVLHFMIVGDIALPEIIPHAYKNIRHILMDQLTVVCIQHVVGAAFFVQAQRQRPVLIFVAEGKLHLIPVSEFFRTSVDSLPDIIRLSFAVRLPALYQDRLQQLPDLPFLHLKLGFIRHSLIHTASAGGKRTAHRFPCLQRRFLRHLQKPALHFSFPFLLHRKPDLLPGNAVFHCNLLFPGLYAPLVGKIHFLNNTLVYFAFFHSPPVPVIYRSRRLPEGNAALSHRIFTLKQPRHKTGAAAHKLILLRLQNNRRNRRRNPLQNLPDNPEQRSDILQTQWPSLQRLCR